MKARWSIVLGAVCFLLGISASSFVLRAVESCIRGKAKESLTIIKNGDFKILVRSQEFHHSAIQNVDICVATSPSTDFPTRPYQCFLHGFDFSELSARWKSGSEIEVSFAGGRVTKFENSAFVYPHGSVPVEFHVTLCDACRTALNNQR
jgi:hypothetical protein